MKKILMLVLAILMVASSAFAMKLYLTNTTGSGLAQANPNASLGGYRSTTELSATSMKNLFDDVSIVEALIGDTEYRMIDVYNDGTHDATRVLLYTQTPTSSPNTALTYGYSVTNQPHINSWNGEALANESTAPASPAMSFVDSTMTSPLDLGAIPAKQAKRVCIRRIVSAGAPWTAHDLGRFGLKWASSATTNYVADPNCMAAFYMNANNATETDRTGNGENATEFGGSMPTSADVPPGYSGTSRDFELGDTEILTVPEGGELDIYGANQPMSLFMWVKSETTAAYAAAPRLFTKYYVAGTLQYILQLSTGGVGNAYLSPDGSTIDGAVGATSVTSDGLWHHIGFVYNDTDVRIYVDGVLDSNGASNPKAYTAGIANTTIQLTIGGGYVSAATPFDGLIDEVIVFNRALSAAEVLDIKNNGISGNRGGYD